MKDSTLMIKKFTQANRFSYTLIDLEVINFSGDEVN